jgi:hypothetical protein
MMRYAGVLAIALAATTAHAEGTFGNWKTVENGGKCHAIANPAQSDGSVTRGQPYVAIQNVPADDVRGSIAFVSGTEATGDGDVAVSVDGQSFEVLPFKDSAFAASGNPEASLVTAMRRGHDLKVEWSLKDGAKVTDHYDLGGFSAAKQDIDVACR